MGMGWGDDESLAVAAANIAAPVFEREEWRYGRPGEDIVPTEGALALTVARLLDAVHNGAIAATGGRFRVVREEDGVFVYLQLGHILDGRSGDE